MILNLLNTVQVLLYLGKILASTQKIKHTQQLSAGFMETRVTSGVQIGEMEHEGSLGHHGKRPLSESNKIDLDRIEDVRSDFRCDECGKCLSSKRNLERHYWTHTGDRPFQCTVCKQEFTRKEILKEHIRRRHTGEKPYSCTDCKKSFATKLDLTRHCYTHNGLKPYQCTECGQKFAQKASFVHHTRKKHGGKSVQIDTGEQNLENFQCGKIPRHMEENTLTCTVCDRLFPTKTRLTEHIRVHTGEKPFECTVCDKTFRQKSFLTDHLRTHSGERPFECLVCGKSFTTKSNLSVHLRSHTGERLHECSKCDKTFARKPDLTRHFRTHTGERPFTCDVCKKSFARKSHLTRHLRIHK